MQTTQNEEVQNEASGESILAELRRIETANASLADVVGKLISNDAIHPMMVVHAMIQQATTLLSVLGIANKKTPQEISEIWENISLKAKEILLSEEAIALLVEELKAEVEEQKALENA